MLLNKHDIVVVFCKDNIAKECPYGGTSHKPIFTVLEHHGGNFNFCCSLITYFCVSEGVKSPLTKSVAAKVTPTLFCVFMS